MALNLERGVALALGVTIVAFACGSSVVGEILLYARPLRWVCLGALVVVGVSYALAARTPRRPPAATYASLALAALALASTAWSVAPRLTFERAGTFLALVVVATALHAGSAGDPAAVRMLLAGILVGMVVVAVAGLVVLLVAHSDAVQPASYEYPVRFRGLGQNPDTMALLFALGTPLATYFALGARTITVRIASVAALTLFAGSIAASGSRGAMLGGLAGTLALIGTRSATWRQRSALAAVAFAVFGACIGVSQIPQAKHAPTAAVAASVAPTKRTLFTSSGRTAAWRGAIRQAAGRPVLGYGFGTEARVFVNRYAGFASQLPENSYIGAALQLGITGLALLAAAAGFALARCAARAQRMEPAPRAVAAACTGTTVAALVVAVTQSYLFSVGNVATVTAWVSLFLIVAATELPGVEVAGERRQG